MSSEIDKEALRREILDLGSQRDKVEREIKDWQAILKTVCEFVYLITITIEIITFEFFDQQNVGMEDDLVDEQGFPRNDIDVYQVRMARNKIICMLLMLLINLLIICKMHFRFDK